MSYPNLGNGWTSTLSGAINSSDTTVDVAATAGMPSRPFQAVILAEGANSDEIVTVTNLSTSTITITRHTEANAAGSSSGSSHASGATISHVLTAESLRASTSHANAHLTVATNTAAILVGFAGTVGAAKVQSKGPSSVSGGSGVTLDSTPTQGNVLVGFYYSNQYPLSDSNGFSCTNVTWSRVARQRLESGDYAILEVWLGTVGASASSSVVINPTNNNTQGLYVEEWSGLADVTCVASDNVDANTCPRGLNVASDSTSAFFLWTFSRHASTDVSAKAGDMAASSGFPQASPSVTGRLCLWYKVPV